MNPLISAMREYAPEQATNLIIRTYARQNAETWRRRADLTANISLSCALGIVLLAMAVSSLFSGC